MIEFNYLVTYQFTDTGEKFQIVESGSVGEKTEYEGRPVEKLEFICCDQIPGAVFKGWFPGKAASQFDHREALAKEPLHTTSSDYKSLMKKAGTYHEL